MLPSPEKIKKYITEQLHCTHIEVSGDGSHFYATIVSEVFEGKTLIERQRLINSILGNRMKSEIHAISMKTKTPMEFKSS